MADAPPSQGGELRLVRVRVPSAPRQPLQTREGAAVTPSEKFDNMTAAIHKGIAYAITHALNVAITYAADGQPNAKHTVRPVGLYQRQGGWHAVGYSNGLGVRREFRLDRIMAVKVLAPARKPTTLFEAVREVLPALSNPNSETYTETCVCCGSTRMPLRKPLSGLVVCAWCAAKETA